MGLPQFLAIGDKLFPEGTVVPEQVRLSLDYTGPRLMVALKNPAQDEIVSYQRAAFKVGLFSYAGILFVLFRAGNQAWTDAPFSMAVERLRADFTEFEEPFKARIAAGKKEILNVFLVDSPSGVILARRATQLPDRANAEFRRVVGQQLKDAEGLNQQAVVAKYNAAIDRAYQVYSTPAMAKAASHVFEVPILATN